MYNRYLPNQNRCAPVERPDSPKQTVQMAGAAALLEKTGAQLTGFLKKFHLEKWDSGDILLILVVLLLWKEEEDMDLLLALGAALLLGKEDT